MKHLEKDFQTALKALVNDFNKSDDALVETADLQYSLSIFKNSNDMYVVVLSYRGTTYIGLDLGTDWNSAKKRLKDYINLNALHA